MQTDKSFALGDAKLEDLRKLTFDQLVIACAALSGVLKMKEIDLARERVARYYADYNYASAMLTKSKKELEMAEARNRGEPTSGQV